MSDRGPRARLSAARDPSRARQPSPVRRPAALVATAAALLIVLAGCSAGRVDMISLDFASIDPPRPAPFPVEVDHCEWWTDDDGALWLGLERRAGSLLGKAFASEFRATFRLDRPPSGAARNYTLNSDSLRGRLKLGPSENRFSSVSGILALYREPGGALRGSLRATVTRTTLQLLGQWGRAPRMLWLATFTARPAAAPRTQLVRDTEDAGFDRGRSSAATSSRPAASRPSAHAALP